MLKATSRLKKILDETPKTLLNYSDEAASKVPAPGKWCKKEILGHLIDSAGNNHQRFVRMQIENKLDLPQYKQNEWVETQKYRNRNWIDVVKLWMGMNMHIVHIFENVDPATLSNTARFPEYGELTLQFIIDDYVDHMEHHLKQIVR